MRWRVLGVGATFAVLVGLVLLYLLDFLTVAPPALSAVVQNGTARLTLQTVPTYEGAHDVHALILGRAITGENAF